VNAFWPLPTNRVSARFHRPGSCLGRQHLRGIAVQDGQILPGIPAERLRQPCEDACASGHNFVHWYNFELRHGGIRYVTPAQRHAGEDLKFLQARHQTYLLARERHPARWSGRTRDCSSIGAVTLNPERDSVIRNYLRAEVTKQMVA
jgi:hypothetical protein